MRSVRLDHPRPERLLMHSPSDDGRHVLAPNGGPVLGDLVERLGWPRELRDVVHGDIECEPFRVIPDDVHGECREVLTRLQPIEKTSGNCCCIARRSPRLSGCAGSVPRYA